MTRDLAGTPDDRREAERLFIGVVFGDPTADPHEGYRALRERAPVLVTESGTVVLSRFADVDAALRHRALGKDARTTSTHLAQLPQEQVQQALGRLRRSMLLTNPPDHTRLRRLVSDVFTPRHVERLREPVGTLVDRLLDELLDRPGADFIQTVALPLPVIVICDLLGVPDLDRVGFAPVVREMVEIFEPFADAQTLARAVAAEGQLADYFSGLLNDKRNNPGDDLLSRLAASRAQDALDDTEMVATAILLFAAGFETTVNLLANGIHALLSHPDQLAELRRNPKLAARAVQEMLRFDPPAHLDSRTALQPCTLAGLDLTPGQLVITLIAAANRDPARFTNADRLDVTRDEGPHLAFGTGIHHCLGAPLARLEAVEFFTRLLARCSRIELAGQPRRRAGRSLPGFADLPVTAHAN